MLEFIILRRTSLWVEYNDEMDDSIGAFDAVMKLLVLTKDW